jgi:hypothetical protein
MIQTYQLFSVLVSLLILILESIIVRRDRGKRQSVSVIVMAYIIHVLIFYASVWIKDLNFTDFGTRWSSMLRMHGLLSILLLTIYRLMFHRKGPL